MKKELDIDKLEEVKVTFDKEAFRAKSMHCDACNRIMKQIRIDMGMPDSFLSVRLNAFRCTKCKKEYLNFEEARKLDRALLISRLMKSDNYKIRKSLSFDGDNYIFRIPVDVTRNLGKNPHADMIPLSSKELLIHFDTD